MIGFRLVCNEHAGAITYLSQLDFLFLRFAGSYTMREGHHISFSIRLLHLEVGVTATLWNNPIPE